MAFGSEYAETIFLLNTKIIYVSSSDILIFGLSWDARTDSAKDELALDVDLEITATLSHIYLQQTKLALTSVVQQSQNVFQNAHLQCLLPLGKSLKKIKFVNKNDLLLPSRTVPIISGHPTVSSNLLETKCAIHCLLGHRDDIHSVTAYPTNIALTFGAIEKWTVCHCDPPPPPPLWSVNFFTHSTHFANATTRVENQLVMVTLSDFLADQALTHSQIQQTRWLLHDPEKHTLSVCALPSSFLYCRYVAQMLTFLSAVGWVLETTRMVTIHNKRYGISHFIRMQLKIFTNLSPTPSLTFPSNKI